MSGKNRLCIVKRKSFDVRRGKPKGWIFGVVDRRTADAAAVSQKVRKLSERRHGGGRLKNIAQSGTSSDVRKKQVVYREVELRNVNVR